MIVTIQNLYTSGESIRTIAKITGKDRRTIRKYITGNTDMLCKSSKRSSLDVHIGFILNNIKEGQTASSIAKQLKEEGCQYTLSNIRQYVMQLAKEHGLEIAKYCSTSSKNNQNGKSVPKKDYITRKRVFRHLWMKTHLDPDHRDYLWMQYESLPELDLCIREFRDIFSLQSIPRLHLFINRYSRSTVKEIASFANGLLKDLEAVENAVSSSLSNGFVEGTNSKVKTIKKAMYGRCGKLLLEEKLMYEKK